MTRFLSRLISTRQRQGLALIAAILISAACGFAVHLYVKQQPEEWSYSRFSQALSAGSVSHVTMEDGGLAVTPKSGPAVFVRLPVPMLDSAFLDRLAQAGAEVTIERPHSDLPAIMGALTSLLLVGFFGLFAFLQFDLKGKLAWPAVAGSVSDRFKDVAGQDEAKAELAEIVTFLRDRRSFDRVGARPPRGVLMVGPPGTGKTLLARALAGESGVSFLAVAGSDFSAAFVGVSKGRVARLFREARRRAPCILFIDEIDSVGKKRGAGGSAADREYDTTLNQILVEMDGFSGSSGVIVVGATNRVDVLDPALLRPGRFDRQVQIGLPDIGGRQSILAVHVARVPLADGVDLRTVARGTPGFSGAELANLVNEAAVLAARDGAATVSADHFEKARNKMLMGLARPSLVLQEQERRLVAVHEAGHALCAMLLPAADPVHSATIVPHGQALGMVMRLPENDRVCVPADKLRADLVVAMGGRAAEEVVFGADRVTTGAASDIGFATDLARRMVTEWGMSPRLGMVRMERRDAELPARAEEEVRRIIEESYAAAREMVQTRRETLDRIAQELLARETLTGAEMAALVGTGRGESLPAAAYCADA